MKVLIADDEPQYCDYPSATLSEQGHDVKTAETGRNAIDVGVDFRPNILIADWLLKSYIHGLLVSRVLRGIDPSLTTILISGFSSNDLKTEALKADVYKFFGKPFDLNDLVAAVQEVASEQKPKASPGVFGVVRVDTSDLILYANQKAKEVVADTDIRSGAKRLGDLFDESTLAHLNVFSEEWIQVAPLTPEPTKWWVRSKKLPDGRIFVFLTEDQDLLRKDIRVQLLLEISDPNRLTWPYEDHVLIIDDDELLRTFVATLLEEIRCVCYRAATQDLALRLFEADPKVGVVLVDYEMPGVNLRSLVSALRITRPDVKIIGNSGGDHKRDFAALGVERFLQKPWYIGDLIDLLKG